MSIFLFNREQNKNSVPNRFIKHSFFIDVCTKFVPYVRVHGRPHGGDGCRWQPLIADRSGSVDRPYNICVNHNVWCRGRRPRRPFAFPFEGKASHSAHSPLISIYYSVASVGVFVTENTYFPQSGLSPALSQR